MSEVIFSGATKRYGSVVALDALDLVIEDGAFVSLLGPSGSGKSTTLNLLAGLIPIEQGDIRIDGHLVNSVSPDKRDVAMVFQNYALYPHMTVYENLAFPLRARGRRISTREIDVKVTDVSTMLGVHALLERFPKELSGGQQQRVALGRAMVREPKVFLLDEPLSNLDARLRIRMRSDIKDLHNRLSTTIVYVTHDQSEAMAMSDKIAVFNLGRLQQYGTPREIYGKPANLFVANFVGDREMNTLLGTFTSEGSSLHFQHTDISIDLGEVGGQLKQSHSPEATCGIRMEDVKIDPNNTSDSDTKAIVRQVELSGPDQVIRAELASGTSLWCRTDPRQLIEAGQTVGIGFPAERLHFFDVKSETSLLD